MATTASYRSSSSNLSLPNSTGDGSERRRPNRVPPPPAPLNVPEPVDIPRAARRPPSPLRNSYTAEDEHSEDGSDNRDDEASIDRRSWSQRSHSPSPSLTKFASNIAHRVGTFMGNSDAMNSRELPTEAEIEAEAQREREKSRHEAEMIIRREEEARKMVEDGVFAMIEKNSPQNYSLPPPPARSQTMPSNVSSASSSPKDKESWFSAVKNKLTPTKEPLTPAQQIIQDTKAREKDKKKVGKEKEKEWPATPGKKYSDPAFANLASSAVSPDHATPPRPITQDSFIMTPSPKRSVDSRDAPPLYAQFDSHGTLDMPGTLLVVARRFEKLERWTVSHVRALEERMGDVERWLVEKEKEKEKEDEQSHEKSSFHSDEDEKDNGISELRDEIMELQGRVGELGREMAKLMIAPLNLNTGPSRNAVVSHASPPVPPTPSSIAPRSLPTLPLSTPRQINTVLRPKEVSPPPSSAASSSVISNGSSRTRLPYPTGDYTSPPGSGPIKQEILSPASSPPSSLTESSRKRPVSIAGLPSASSNFFQSSASGPSTPGLPARQESTIRAVSSNSPSSKISSSSARWQTNVSPTPRKRYTVALGQPISVANTIDTDDYDTRQRFTASPESNYETPAEDGDSEMTSEDGDSEARAIGHFRDDTIGKSETRLANPPTFPNDTIRRSGSITSPPRTSPGMARIRAQSSYGPPTGFNLDLLSSSSSPANSPTPIAPLRPRLRSRSIDPVGLGISDQNGIFVDPLVIRKHERETLVPKTPVTPKYERGRPKVPIGELVAFFNKDPR